MNVLFLCIVIIMTTAVAVAAAAAAYRQTYGVPPPPLDYFWSKAAAEQEEYTGSIWENMTDEEWLECEHLAADIDEDECIVFEDDGSDHPVICFHEQTPGVYNPPINTYYSELPVTLNKESMRFVIGKDGIAFKAITHQAGVLYLWFNEQKSVIEVWGHYSKLEDAKKRLTERMKLIESQQWPALK